VGINVFWQDENGNDREGVLDPHMLLSRIVRSEMAISTSLVRFIDPYGDTTFNQLQIPDLITELTGAKEWQLSSDERAHLDKVIQLVRRSMSQHHTYVKFVGD
jgi:hypothetical protein